MLTPALLDLPVGLDPSERVHKHRLRVGFYKCTEDTQFWRFPGEHRIGSVNATLSPPVRASTLTLAFGARLRWKCSPRDADRIMSGNCGVVAIWVTQPVWPLRVPLTVICSVILATFGGAFC